MLIKHQRINSGKREDRLRRRKGKFKESNFVQ